MSSIDWPREQAALLTAMHEATGAKIASILCLSPSVVSGLTSPQNHAKYSQVELAARLIAACGLRLVPADQPEPPPPEEIDRCGRWRGCTWINNGRGIER